jgi:carbamoylphosphate synthase large subunit
MADFSEDKSRKKLLVLAGAGPHAKVVESAKEMGLYTVVADYLPESVYSPAKLIADESLMINIYDVDGLTEYCRKNEIDGVINFCIDPAQKPCQQLADNLGLPAFGTSEQVTVLTDKIKFKKICRETGVDVIDEFTESDVKNGTVKYPVIVKPNDSRGSRGATVCWNGKEVENALFTAKSESSNGEILIEKYFSGGGTGFNNFIYC